jgi:hypothetical protein
MASSTSIHTPRGERPSRRTRARTTDVAIATGYNDNTAAVFRSFHRRTWRACIRRFISSPSTLPRYLRTIVDKLAVAASQAAQDSSVVAALEKQGFQPLIMSPEQFDAFYRAERDKWGKVIKETSMDQN